MRKPGFIIEGRGHINSIIVQVSEGQEAAGFDLFRRALPALEALDRIMRDSAGVDAMAKRPAKPEPP